MTNMHVFPTSTAGSGKYIEIPETICRGCPSAKSTLSLSSLSVSGIFSAESIFPAFISTFAKSSNEILAGPAGCVGAGAVDDATGAGAAAASVGIGFISGAGLFVGSDVIVVLDYIICSLYESSSLIKITVNLICGHPDSFAG
mgnify:CR=1 FL=1